VATQLRDGGLHVRHTHKATRNVGKQLREAAAVGARHVVILGDELATGEVVLKNLEAGEQRTVPLADLVVALGRTDA
jgi:histidyl-tRNA synthetase